MNYWGYNSLGFFAPHAPTPPSGDRGQQVTEFKADGQGVPRGRPRGHPRRRLQPHRRGRRRSARRCRFRGLDDLGFYHRVAPPAARARPGPDADTYWDVTGCGNTVDADHPRRCG